MCTTSAARTSGSPFHQVSAASIACGTRVKRSAWPRRRTKAASSRAGPLPKVRKRATWPRWRRPSASRCGSRALAAWWGGRCGVTISTFIGCECFVTLGPTRGELGVRATHRAQAAGQVVEDAAEVVEEPVHALLVGGVGAAARQELAGVEEDVEAGHAVLGEARGKGE